MTCLKSPHGGWGVLFHKPLQEHEVRGFSNHCVLGEAKPRLDWFPRVTVTETHKPEGGEGVVELKTTEMCYLTVLESRSLKPR